MNVLPRTEEALAGLKASDHPLFGMHTGEGLRANTTGLLIAERDYDPVKDNPFQINQLSPWADVVGEPQVGLYRPDLPIRFSVVRHERQVPRQDYLNISASRIQLADDLSESIKDAVPGISDHVYGYAVGNDAREDFEREVEAIKTDGSPEADAEAIADLCRNGLTLVISDFLRLPLETHSDLPMTVAVKTNHPFELELVPRTGSIPLGDGAEINTNNPRELQAANDRLQKAHTAKVAGLRASGIAVAHIVAKPNLPHGYELDSADAEIATAINSLVRE